MILVGMGLLASSLTACSAVVEDTVAADGVAGLAVGAVQADLDGHQPAGGQPLHQGPVEQGAVGGDAGHDAPLVAGGQDLFEVGAHERLAAAEIDLEDPGAVQNCSTRSRASAVVSSLRAATPEDERQWLQRRLQASVTSQVRFTGERSPISTNLLLTDESLFPRL